MDHIHVLQQKRTFLIVKEFIIETQQTSNDENKTTGLSPQDT